jgi:hypothetical protein
MIWITAANYLKEFKVSVTFNSGESYIIDLKDELTGEIFAPLKDPQVFRAVKFEPELDTIIWENGADFAPEFLYELARKQKDNRSA